MNNQKSITMRQVTRGDKEYLVEGIAYAEFNHPSWNEVLVIEAFYQKAKVKPYVVARCFRENAPSKYDRDKHYSFRTKVEALEQYNEWYDASLGNQLMIEIYCHGKNRHTSSRE
jgi:hypothetical protein